MVLPVCDHYSGVEARMLKSLALQSEMTQEFDACVFDVTLDCEDGARVGGEREHAQMVREIVERARNKSAHENSSKMARVAVRLHPVDHPAFQEDVEIIIGGAAAGLCHVMLPKVESVEDVERAAQLIDQAALLSGRLTPLPLHVLIESARAVGRAAGIASHARVQSMSFGLMDFVSSHGGAIPASAMGVDTSVSTNVLDQFSHPLVLRAKLEISAACHAEGKVPSHCVVTEFSDATAIKAAAVRAFRSLGYLRMWSVHPAQIRPILAAFSPQTEEIDVATNIILNAANADWAPISFGGQLHDRASYRYYWQVLERARQTGAHLAKELTTLWH
ncbi:MAG: aldolase/citrate lyase family protein [Rhodoferax sp.]|nr:aldolase/citrate lyase family protein [Rhodoferax sp.]